MNKPLRYEVDLPMLPDGADSNDLSPFCKALECVMEVAGDDLVEIIPTFFADNRDADAAWGWPTVDQWNCAVEIYFGVHVLRRRSQV